MKRLSPKSTFKVVCPWEKNLPIEEQTVFICSYLDAEQQGFLDNHSGYNGANGYVLEIGTTNLMALHMGLKEIENYPNESGEPFKLVRDQTAKKDTFPGVGRPWLMSNINEIEQRARNYVAQQIKTNGKLEEEEAKNS